MTGVGVGDDGTVGNWLGAIPTMDAVWRPMGNGVSARKIMRRAVALRAKVHSPCPLTGSPTEPPGPASPTDEDHSENDDAGTSPGSARRPRCTAQTPPPMRRPAL